MPMTTVEFDEAGQRMDEMIDTVLQGREVMITYLGEPAALVHLHQGAREEPPAWLRETVVEALDYTLAQLRVQLDPPAWLLN